MPNNDSCKTKRGHRSDPSMSSISNNHRHSRWTQAQAQTRAALTLPEKNSWRALVQASLTQSCTSTLHSCSTSLSHHMANQKPSVPAAALGHCPWSNALRTILTNMYAALTYVVPSNRRVLPIESVCEHTMSWRFWETCHCSQCL